MYPRTGNFENYFDHDADIGLIGRGETIESCFTDTARVMFALMADVEKIHLTQVITFEFNEENLETALVTWLNLLLAKAQEHQMMFGDFRLEKQENIWKATVSGEKWQDDMERSVTVKSVTMHRLSVKKINHLWEARCLVDV
jgi:SHS2 domain-containing protein